MTVPTLLQHATGAQNTTIFDSSQIFWLPEPSQANNCLLVAVQSDTSVTGAPTITDDKGNTWILLGDVVGGQRLSLLGAFGVAAGTSKITVSFTGSSPSFTEIDFVGEFNNVNTGATPLDHAAATNASSASPVKSGSQTTATAGDLIVQVICDVTTGPPTAVTKFAPNAGFTMSGTNTVAGMASQWGIQAAAGAINPGITITGGTDNFASITIALKSAAAGTALPAGMRIFGMLHLPAYASVVTTSMGFQFPTSGNLFAAEVLSFSLAAAATISSITDSKSNTWQNRAGPVSGLNQVQNEIWSAENATPGNDLTGTLNWSASLAGTVGGDSHIVLVDIIGADTAPFDVAATATGTQLVAGNLNTVTINPTTANGTILCMGDIFSHTASGTAGVATPHLFVEPAMDGGGNDLDEDALWAHYHNPNTNAVTFTFTIQHNTAGVQGWGSVAAAFKAPSTGSAASAAGSATATGTGASTVGSNVASTGAATATGTGASTAAVPASSVGVGTATGAAASLSSAAALSTGLSTAILVGASQVAGVASGDALSAGISTAIAQGASVAAGDGLAAGTSTAIATTTQAAPPAQVAQTQAIADGGGGGSSKDWRSSADRRRKRKKREEEEILLIASLIAPFLQHAHDNSRHLE